MPKISKRIENYPASATKKVLHTQQPDRALQWRIRLEVVGSHLLHALERHIQICMNPAEEGDIREREFLFGSKASALEIFLKLANGYAAQDDGNSHEPLRPEDLEIMKRFTLALAGEIV